MESHVAWLQYLRECYSNGTLPPTKIQEGEIEWTEDVVYRSGLPLSFEDHWMKQFPPLLIRQNAKLKFSVDEALSDILDYAVE